MRKFLAETLGTSLITLAVIGSGIMASNLTDDVAIQLLLNCLSTVGILYLSITVFSEISGSHFNPMVSIFALSRKNLGLMFGYIAAQISGATLGALTANLMFEKPAITISSTIRDGNYLLLGEFIAAAGLVFIIFFKAKKVKRIRPVLIALWIMGAYFFTSSTSFANPAVTFGRMFTDTFAGVAPSSAVMFIAIQIIGSSAGYSLTLAMRKK